MTNHKLLLFTSAAATFARPIMENIICPYLQGYKIATIDNICTATVVTTSIVPTLIGTSIGISSLYQQHSITSLFSSIASSAINLVLPAGLGMVAAQLVINDHDIPPSAFAIGTVKSSFEITTIGAVMKTINTDGSLGGLAVAGYTISNQVLYGGLIAISITSAINTIHYTAKELLNGNEASMELSFNATDYALGFAIARPLYQVGTYFLTEAHQNVHGAGCMFAAPIARGYVLGVLGKGSLTVPGSNYGIASNVLDGTAIAVASLTRSELAKLDTFKTGAIGAGNAVTATLLAIIAAHKIHENYDAIQERVLEYSDFAYDCIVESVLGSNDVPEIRTTTDEL